MIQNHYSNDPQHMFGGVSLEGRQNILVNVMIKDVQVYHDSLNTSQLINQMAIPISADGQQIQVVEWLIMFAQQYKIRLNSAQYTNIWDPVEAKYTNISSLRYFPTQNLRNTQLLYIRYLPLQETAVPPHASYLAMIEDTQNLTNLNENGNYFQNQKPEENSWYQTKPKEYQIFNQLQANRNDSLSSSSQSYQMQQQQLQHQQQQELMNPIFQLESRPNQQNDWNPIQQNLKLEDIPQSQMVKNEEDNDETKIANVAKPQSRKMSSIAAFSSSSTTNPKRKDSEQSEYNYDSSSKKAQLAREKRVKERKISYVKGKVDQWRNLYEVGQQNANGQIERVNLDQAAQLVGLSRKTLDDYYAQLRKAKSLGFDFDMYASEKMGSLRKYVKKMSESGINPLLEGNGNDDSFENQERGTNKNRHFNTPQLKPIHESDTVKHDLSLSVKQKKAATRKYSETTYDLMSKTPAFQTPYKPFEHGVLNKLCQDQSSSQPDCMEEEEDREEEENFQLENQFEQHHIHNHHYFDQSKPTGTF